MSRALPALLSVWMAASGCLAATWERCGAERLNGPEGSTFSAPPGWLAIEVGDDTVLSLDGPSLQAIRVLYRTETPSEEEIDTAVPTSELAEVYIAELRKLTSGQVEILANEPASIAAKPGFRVRVRHNRHVQRLPVDAYEIYGVADDHGLFILSYGAFETYLFERDLEAFRGLVQSFRLPP
jgi:hypothetical protein